MMDYIKVSLKNINISKIRGKVMREYARDNKYDMPNELRKVLKHPYPKQR